MLAEGAFAAGLQPLSHLPEVELGVQPMCAVRQVYSVELLGVMGQACKRQLDTILHAVAPPEQQPEAGALQAPCLIQPLQLTRALFILLQNPLNGVLPCRTDLPPCSMLAVDLPLCSMLAAAPLSLWLSNLGILALRCW